MENTGLSEVNGSWKIMAMPRPRSSRGGFGCARSKRSAPSYSAPDGDARIGGEQAHQRERDRRLAAAGFADQPEDPARPGRKRHVAHGMVDAGLGGEIDC